jgi:hypothetical protein
MPTKDTTPMKIMPNLPNDISKDAIIEDLRRKLEESEISSNAGSSSCGRRGRRQNRRPKSAFGPGLASTKAPILPRLSETKPVRLQIGLNLDLELELKARIQGDISLSLV